MRTSLAILFICAICSCSLFRNRTTTKRSTEVQSQALLATMQTTAERKSALVAQTFWTSDSSESVSMIEIVPKGVVSYAETAGFKTEASSIRIFTKRKTGKVAGGDMLKSDRTDSVGQTSTLATSAHEMVDEQKRTEDKLPTPLMLIIGTAFAIALLLCAVKFRKLYT